MTIEALKDECKVFSNEYTEDVDGEALYKEICHLKQVHCANINPEGTDTPPIELLNKLRKSKLYKIFGNICIALRIFLTLPVSVASAERSFSKLKIIKNKLRNSSTQERLVALSSLSIESDLARKIDFSNIIDAFAAKKARKVPL